MLPSGNHTFLAEYQYLSRFKIPYDPAANGNGESVFTAAFKDKVLLYLYEDAGKMHHPALFANDKASYSELCDEFDHSGVAIFKGIDISSITTGDGDGNVGLPDEE